MENLLENLTLSVSLAAVVLMLSVVIVNIYLIKREGFRVSVNCWFCNQWTKVLYRNRNSFECPNCQQYNGFTKDGGYNKVINAQHDTSTMKTVDKTKLSTNGLCTYCNNNQRMKVHQLANFVPLDEKNYDMEIEHFRQQLEKSYRLCKKCDEVLKTILDHQHAWLFGNRLKNWKNKVFNVMSPTKKIQQRIHNFTFLRNLLSAITIITLCNLLNVKIELPSFKNIHQFIPNYFTTYTVIFNDYYKLMKNNSQIFVEEFIDLNQFNFDENFVGTMSVLGFLLQVCLVLSEKFSNWWKANEMLIWMLLFLTSSFPLNSVYSGEIKVLQVLISSTLLYSYLRGKSLPKFQKDCEFKKIRTASDISSRIDDDQIENLQNPVNETKVRSSPDLTHLNRSQCEFNRTSSPIQSPKFQNRFATAKTTSILNSSSTSSSPSPHNDLHRSLDNLHLNNLSFRPQPCSSPVFSVNSSKRPVLSPPKLKTVTQNPWTAGGFWKNDIAAYQVGVEDMHPSRSSSQTSGFVSNHAFGSLPASRDHSLCGDVERTSILSEPTYHVNPFSTARSSGQLYYKADNNTFYPVLQQNSMLYLHPNYSAAALSVKSTSPRPNLAPSPLFFTDKPFSGVFKNASASALCDSSFYTARF